MTKQTKYKPYFKVGALLLFISFSMLAYAKFIITTEASAASEIIDRTSCRAKNNAFSSTKRICTNYKFMFTYEGIKYYGRSKLVRLEFEADTHDKVYFSSMRPQATASLRSTVDRGEVIIALAFSALALSLYFFYKQLVSKPRGDGS
ncbi:hypothetical protein [Pseudomonas sp. 9AZ]|uniref:hypothetical protein n=1 Tax=Pseudomonas sp. 9AZ TaxID=2653168 RepID=UPI001357FC8A|nr:hypothetical protein [Pseudomonas sp. 9AZ]